jgi:hypothetical protein
VAIILLARSRNIWRRTCTPLPLIPVAQQPPPPPQWATASLPRLHDPTQTHHSIRLLWASDQPDRDLCLTHNIPERQTSIPPLPYRGFEPAFPANERQHTYAADRAATRIGVPVPLYPPQIPREAMSVFTGFPSEHNSRQGCGIPKTFVSVTLVWPVSS